MARYAVLADDMTGAGDAGVHFAAAGLRTALALDPARIAAALADHDVVSLSTESRFLQPDAAAEGVAAAVRSCRAAGVTHYFKKIDSTLRGNLAAELSTALRESGGEAVLLCPAMPKTGRTVVGGVLLVDGVPVVETELGRDPFTPVPHSRISLLLPGFVSIDIALDEVRAGVASVAARMDALVDAGCTAIVADAVRDDDLAILAAALRLCGRSILPAGAGGFAEAVAGAPRSAAGPDAMGRLLAVVGSLTSAASAQIAHALDRDLYTALSIDMDRALADPDRELARLADAAAGAGDGDLLIANTAVPRRADALDRSLGLRAAAFFGAAARTVAARAGCTRLYVTGGSTAVAVADALGLDAITLVRECMPGVVLGACRPAGSPVRWFITKAGGFGSPDTLSRLASGASVRRTQGTLT
ncbi:MAG: hypothetical protein LUE17_07390 [Planctomycetaceae bacterium]|nr:hypothetical protein [Planctomycetaceae bacterium]